MVPGERVLTQAFLWRLVDLEEADGRRIDLVIATKFPSYVVRHPNKVVWLVHQFRQAYELDRTELGQFGESPEERATRRTVQRLDRVALGEARKVFATSETSPSASAARPGSAPRSMPHPPQRSRCATPHPSDFVLSVDRLDRAKRIDLLLEAAAADPGLRCVIVGEGPDRERLEGSPGTNGARHVRRPGLRRELADLYGRCLAVYYAPVDEDFGMVPYEAFLAEKPVVTTTDAGGPLEIVSDRVTGLVAEPRAEALAAALGTLNPTTPRPRAGRERRSPRPSRGTRHRPAARVSRRSPTTPRCRRPVRDRRLHALLLPELSARLDVVVASRGRFSGPPKADVALYHVGNDPNEHGWIVDELRRRPGVVVLHELVLHHLVAGMTLARGTSTRYLAHWSTRPGLVGRRLAHAVQQGKIPPLWETRPRSSRSSTSCSTTPPG